MCDWIQYVFGVNQLMFCILKYFTFSNILSYANVHSTWHVRLPTIHSVPFKQHSITAATTKFYPSPKLVFKSSMVEQWLKHGYDFYPILHQMLDQFFTTYGNIDTLDLHLSETIPAFHCKRELQYKDKVLIGLILTKWMKYSTQRTSSNLMLTNAELYHIGEATLNPDFHLTSLVYCSHNESIYKSF